MLHRSRFAAIASMLFAAILVLMGCGSEASPNQMTPPPPPYSLAKMEVGETLPALFFVVVVDAQQNCWLDLSPKWPKPLEGEADISITRLADGYYMNVLNRYIAFYVGNEALKGPSREGYAPIKNCANPDKREPSGTKLNPQYRRHTIGMDLARNGSGWVYESWGTSPSVWIPEGERSACFIDPRASLHPENSQSDTSRFHVRMDRDRIYIDTPLASQVRKMI